MSSDAIRGLLGAEGCCARRLVARIHPPVLQHAPSHPFESASAFAWLLHDTEESKSLSRERHFNDSVWNCAMGQDIDVHIYEVLYAPRPAYTRMYALRSKGWYMLFEIEGMDHYV